MKFKAFLFDLNGTMIDDMDYHIRAWHRILNSLGADISLAQMKEQCYGKNHELLERTFPGRFSYAEKDRMSLEKEKEYQSLYSPSLLPGLKEFLDLAKTLEVPMAIGSAAIRFNIDFVLDRLDLHSYFRALVSADDVQHSKPHPETWLRCAASLGVDPGECLVFEDSPRGVEAAESAGMHSIVLTTLHSPEEFSSYSHVIGMAPDFKSLRVTDWV